MANWSEILNEIGEIGGTQDSIRRKYLDKLAKITGRNVIAYYSGWLQKPTAPSQHITINDNDKNGFMNAVYKLDVTKGLDLILHTPGGETAATESIVDYLRSIFSTNIRAIIPQIAMSGGTMMACAAKEIIMGKQSNLGPIDPQLQGISASGVIEEFERARQEILVNPRVANLWHPILSKYPPSFVGDCQKGINWSETMTRDWLKTGMFQGDPNAQTKIDQIITGLGNSSTLAHARHLSIAKCKNMGFGDKIIAMESNQKLQDAILSVHHTFMLTFDQTPATKIIENNKKGAYIQTLQTLIINK